MLYCLDLNTNNGITLRHALVYKYEEYAFRVARSAKENTPIYPRNFRLRLAKTSIIEGFEGFVEHIHSAQLERMECLQFQKLPRL